MPVLLYPNCDCCGCPTWIVVPSRTACGLTMCSLVCAGPCNWEACCIPGSSSSSQSVSQSVSHSSSSGPTDPGIHTACCPNNVPTVMHVSIVGTGGCMNGFQFDLPYSVPDTAWTVPDGTLTVCGGRTLDAQITCRDDGGGPIWQIGLACSFHGIGFVTNSANASSVTCDPFRLVFTLPPVGSPCFDMTYTITVTPG